MKEEQDKFESQIKEPGTGKLIVDFQAVNLEFESKQIDLGSIKYKSKQAKKKLSKEIVDLKSRKKDSKNLF